MQQTEVLPSVLLPNSNSNSTLQKMPQIPQTEDQLNNSNNKSRLAFQIVLQEYPTETHTFLRKLPVPFVPVLLSPEEAAEQTSLAEVWPNVL